MSAGKYWLPLSSSPCFLPLPVDTSWRRKERQIERKNQLYCLKPEMLSLVTTPALPIKLWQVARPVDDSSVYSGFGAVIAQVRERRDAALCNAPHPARTTGAGVFVLQYTCQVPYCGLCAAGPAMRSSCVVALPVQKKATTNQLQMFIPPDLAAALPCWRRRLTVFA